MGQDMTEQREESKNATMPSLAVKVTINDFATYFRLLSATSDKVKCPVCGSGNWDAPASHEDKSKPMILNLPIPNLKGKGIWHYSLICSNCAYTMFFNCGAVVKKLQESGKL